jgi:hypothetical protein
VNSPTPIIILEMKTIEGATNAGVRQDKSDLIRDRAASDQPYRTPDEIRSNQKSSHLPQSNTTAPQRSNTVSPHMPPDPIDFDGPLVPLTIQIPKHLKAEIQRLAAEEGESDSATARAFLGRGVQANIDMQYGAMLRPVIQDQIHKDIQSYSNRTANINFQALYAAEQSRLMAIHILSFLTDLLDASNEFVPIITACQQNAWKNITKMTSDMPAAPPRREETKREWPS